MVPVLVQFSGMLVVGGRAFRTATAVDGGLFTAQAPRDKARTVQHMLSKTLRPSTLIVFLFTAPSQSSDARQ